MIRITLQAIGQWLKELTCRHDYNDMEIYPGIWACKKCGKIKIKDNNQQNKGGDMEADF